MMHDKEFHQIGWDAKTEDDCRQIVRLAVREDLDRLLDLTTVALVPAGLSGGADIVARREGVLCGLRAARLALDEMDIAAGWSSSLDDGAPVGAGEVLARLDGQARDLLTAERLVLNLIGRLSGVATLTRCYVDAVAGTRARIYDTRKTTPGWRRLEKYAVTCGGGRNHRTGLFDAVLIKDNHLALAGQTPCPDKTGARPGSGGRWPPREAVERIRSVLPDLLPPDVPPAGVLVEVEVDTLEQLENVLPARPDIVLLDNMTPAELIAAVALRDATAPSIELEASGGISLDTVREIAMSGVDRISVGALTHSAVSLDVALDWLPPPDLP